MSLYRLFRSPTAGAVPLRSARPLLHHRWHRCGLGVARLEDRTLLSGPSGDVLAAVAPKIELGTPKTGTLAPGEVAFFQIDPNTDGRLVARVHAEGATTRLSLLDVQGQVLMQSDGQSPGNFDDQIDLHLPAGPNYLEVESLGGAGTYTLTTTLTPGAPPFQPIPAGVAPTSPVAGDFNGDGRTDLAVANFGFSDVSVLLGNGDGTFQDQVRYAAGDHPSALVAGDFNGDGRTDLAVANWGSDDVSVLLGNGDGTFRDQVRSAAGTAPFALVAGDFNGDGRIDLAVANAGSGDVSVLLGNGDGTFRDQVRYAAGDHPSALVAGDFNGDGHTDLAVANWGSGDVSVLLGNGDGTFRDQVRYAAGTMPIALVAGDFNGDGRIDLAVANSYSNDVSVLLGNGDGTFRDQVRSAAGTEPTALVAGDFNGDGRTDLAVANQSSGDVSVLLGNGDGTFRDQVRSAAGTEPTALVAGDFNGDGRTDLAVANQSSGDMSVLLGNGDGTFRDQVRSAAGTEPTAPVAGDFNGDGRTDLAVANVGSGDVSVLLSNGDGTFRDQVRSAAGTEPTALVAGDFNGDGRTDLAVANWGSGDVSVLLGNGDGTFQNQVRYATGTMPIALVAGDFNGDGRTDLAVASGGSDGGSGDVSALLGNGDGTFRDQVRYATGTMPIALVAGDFNGDGRTDLAVASVGSDGAGDVSALLGNGDGTFRDQVRSAAGTMPIALVAGDFNGDGRTDLAAASVGSDGGSGDVSVLLGNGDGTFRDQVRSAAGDYPSALVAGDFNGDGRTDLAVASVGSDGGSDDVSVLLGNGDGTFRDQVRYAAGTAPDALVARDFNGDDRTDLAVANAGSNDVSVLLNLGGTFAAPGPVVTNSHATPLVADLSGDGTDDVMVIDGAGNILWRKGQPQEPGTFDPPITINRGHPARDIVAVDTHQGRVLASVDATDNAISLYGWRDGTFVRIGSLPTGLLPAQIVTANLNGDGWDDLVVRNAGDGTLTVFFNNGSVSDATGDAPFQPPVTLPVGLGVSDVTLADVDRDGATDIVVTNKVSGEVGVLRNLGAGIFAQPVLYRGGGGLYGVTNTDGSVTLTTLEATSGMAAGAFTRGGPSDLVTINPGSNTFSLLAGLGAGRFANPVTIPTASPAQVVRMGDFTGNGIDDLAVLTTSGVSIYLGNGKGGFLPPVTYPVGPESDGLTLADLTGNGKLDLLVGDAYGDVLVLLGKGDGTFQPYHEADQAITLAVADLTGNGSKDVIYADQGLDRVVVDYGAGGSAVLGDQATGLLSPGAVTLADLNGNGILDLIVADSGSNNVLIYPGLGNGQFGPAVNGGHGYFVGTNPVGITVAYLTGDLPDLVVADKGSNQVSILVNQSQQGGAISFDAGPRLNSGGTGPVSTVVGYFTPGSAYQDILVSNSGSNNVALLPGVGGVFFTDPTQTFAVGNDPGPLFEGNFDGKPDLVTVNAGSNDLTVISDFMNADRTTITISSGGTHPDAAFSFSSGSEFDNLVVGNGGDGVLALFEGGPDGLSLISTETEPGLPNPTDLAFWAFTGGQVQFYAATEGSEAATLLTFQLGGETGGMPTVPGLQPLHDSALPLIATLLTLTIETSTAEFDLSATNGEAAAAVSFLPVSTVTVGQSLSEHASTGESENGDAGGAERNPKSPISLSRRNPRPGSRFSWG